MDSEYDLERFVQAQDPVYAEVVEELRAGHKRSHWMWFIFPQIAGLGRSSMAQRYAIANDDVAADYLAHPVLGRRLRECANIVLSLQGLSANDIFGAPDHVKFRSSMTLFADTAPDEAVFQACIDKYFDGEPDPETLARL